MNYSGETSEQKIGERRPVFGAENISEFHDDNEALVADAPIDGIGSADVINASLPPEMPETKSLEQQRATAQETEIKEHQVEKSMMALVEKEKKEYENDPYRLAIARTELSNDYLSKTENGRRVGDGN